MTTDNATQYRHRESITVERDGEELTVWNALNVTMAHQVRGGNPTHETYTGSSRINIYGGGPEPDYVTTWVADELWSEHGIDLGLFDNDGTDEFDIDVIDLEDDGVRVV